MTAGVRIGAPSATRWFGSDPFLLSTATLAPVVLAVALAGRRPGELITAMALSVGAVGVQVLLGRWPGAMLRRRRRLLPLVRVTVALTYVGLAVQLIGGPALPLLALFAPVVAGAAAIGAVQGWFTAVVAAGIYLLPELGSIGSPAAVVLRGITLAGISVILAFGTRRMVIVLESAVREARAATARERRRSRQLNALQAVGDLLATAGPTRELLGRVVDILAVRFGYPLVSLYLGDERHVRLEAQHGYGEALPEFRRDVGVAGRVLRTQELALVGDVTVDPDYVEGTIRATSLICAPLIVGGRFHGLLNVETIEGRRLGSTDRTLISLLAARIAAAVALGQDRQALAARAELLRDVERFGRDVSASLALDALASIILDAVRRVVPADVVAVTLLDREDGSYRVRAVSGAPHELVGRAVELGIGLAGRAIRARAQIVEAGGPALHPTPVPAGDMPEFGCGIGLPLVRDSIVLGALTVGRTASDAEFSDLELEGFQLLASHASLAVANAFLHRDVQELAIRDGLTGLYNRRHFDEALERMLTARRRERLSGWRSLSAIVFDLDHFGVFNKEHGHQIGDEVLRTFSDVLRSRFRASDLVARLGGEEFVVVLDGASREQAIAAADDVRGRLSERPVRGADGEPLSITVSAGCAELDPADPSPGTLLRTADVALFMAKRAGRDRVVAA